MLRKIIEDRRKLHNVELHIFYSFIHHSSMALQPLAGPWPLLQFRNIRYTDGNTPFDECLIFLSKCDFLYSVVLVRKKAQQTTVGRCASAEEAYPSYIVRN